MEDKILVSGRWPEKTDALTRLTLDLVRQQDALRAVAEHVAQDKRLVRSGMAKSALDGIARGAEELAGRIGAVRYYAWEQLLRLKREGRGHDEGEDGAGAEADRGVPVDHAGATDSERDAGAADDGKGPPRGQGE